MLVVQHHQELMELEDLEVLVQQQVLVEVLPLLLVVEVDFNMLPLLGLLQQLLLLEE
tara:strand:+ start:235 stop:405 length:171 start_codon:yes stop_codon:yes gene_type:complete